MSDVLGAFLVVDALILSFFVSKRFILDQNGQLFNKLPVASEETRGCSGTLTVERSDGAGWCSGRLALHLSSGTTVLFRFGLGF